jgi:hypothetical protein
MRYALLAVIAYGVYLVFFYTTGGSKVYRKNPDGTETEIARRKFGGVQSFHQNVSDLVEKPKKKC